MDTTQSPDGTPVATPNGADGAQQQTPAVPPGVQARFDEMTAATRELQRQNQELVTANQQMMANFMAAQAQQRPAAPAAPQVPTLQIPEGMDPAMAQYLKNMNDAWAGSFATLQRQNQEMMGQVTAGVQRTTAQMQLQQMLAAEHPVVAQRAQQLMQDWQARGLQGFNPKDAIVYARGELGAPPPQAQQQRGPGGQFTPAPVQQPWQGGQQFSPFTPGGGAPVPSPVQVQGPGDRLPEATVARMAPKARFEYEQARMLKWGGEDQAIIY